MPKMTPPTSFRLVHQIFTGLVFFALAASSPSTLSSASSIRASAAAIVDESDAPDNIPSFTLANGQTVPLVGLGCASGVGRDDVASAIGAGYRYLDTAQSHSWGYREEEVGDAVFEAGVRWEDRTTGADAAGDGADYVYVQTKIHPQDLGYEPTMIALGVSLRRLRASTLDSVLLHKPRCWDDICPPGKPSGTWQESWKALEEVYDAGIVRAIGICDVDDRILDELLTRRIGPTVVQNWFDPFHQDRALRRRIGEENERRRREGRVGGIMYQGYSTLGSQWKMRGYDENPVLGDPTLLSIADAHGASVAQVVINWAAKEHGVSVLPASTNPGRQADNLRSFGFDLTPDEVRAIDALDGKPPPAPPRKEPDILMVELSFLNQADVPMHVYWVPEGGGDHVQVGSMTPRGGEVSLTSYHGHEFIFREHSDSRAGDAASDTVGRLMNRHVVDRANGSKQDQIIGDASEEL